MNFGKFCVVFVFGVGIAELGRAGQNRIVRQVGVFEQSVDCIEPEAGDAALVPPARHIEHCFLYRGIVPVQVGLLGVEVVIVELVGRRDRTSTPNRRTRRSSCWAAGCRACRRARRTSCDSAIRLRGFRVEEPLVLVGGVVDDVVENDAHAMLLALGGHAIEIGQRAVHGIDVLVVGNVIAEIDLRRGIAGRDPDGVDAQVVQVAHLRRDALEIADAVIVAVGKAARIDLVEHGVLPPLVALGVDRLLLRGGPRGQRGLRSGSGLP